MKPDSEIGALLYIIGAVLLCLAVERLFRLLKARRIRRWKVCAGTVSDAILVPHAAISPSLGQAESQYIIIVSYTFNDGATTRDGRLERRFSYEAAAREFVAHFLPGQTVEVRHSPVWPHRSTLDIGPDILLTEKHLDRPPTTSRSFKWAIGQILLLLGIVVAIIAVCVVLKALSKWHGCFAGNFHVGTLHSGAVRSGAVAAIGGAFRSQENGAGVSGLLGISLAGLTAPIPAILEDISHIAHNPVSE